VFTFDDRLEIIFVQQLHFINGLWLTVNNQNHIHDAIITSDICAISFVSFRSFCFILFHFVSFYSISSHLILVFIFAEIIADSFFDEILAHILHATRMNALSVSISLHLYISTSLHLYISPSLHLYISPYWSSRLWIRNAICNKT
jgi:hypothetical protein